MSEIIIGEKTVMMVKKTIEKEVPLDEFFSQLTQGAPIAVPVLPDSTRGFVSHDLFTGFVIEQIPRTVGWDYNNGRFVHRYNIHMPFMYFFVSVQNNPIVFQHMGICYAKERLVNGKSPMGWMPTPNVEAPSQSYGIVCLGEVRIDNSLEFNVAVNELVNKTVCSEFNSDLFRPTDRCPAILTEAKGKYGNKKALKVEATKGCKVAKYLLDIDGGDNNTMHLYAWEKLSEEISLKDFLDGLEFGDEFNYEKALKRMSRVLDDEEWEE